MIVRPERMDDREASLEVERAAFGRDEEAAAVLAVRDEAGAFAMIVLGDRAATLHGDVRWHPAFGEPPRE